MRREATLRIYSGRNRPDLAVSWQEAFSRLTRDLAGQYLEKLAELERTHGMRLRTVADRLEERFVKPLALDRLCALIAPAMMEARHPEPHRSFARLEKELGARLFERTSRRVQLTAAGEAFLPAARQSLEAAERARAEVAASTGEIRGTLTVGSIPTVAAVDLPAVLRDYRLRYRITVERID